MPVLLRYALLVISGVIIGAAVSAMLLWPSHRQVLPVVIDRAMVDTVYIRSAAVLDTAAVHLARISRIRSRSHQLHSHDKTDLPHSQRDSIAVSYLRSLAGHNQR